MKKEWLLVMIAAVFEVMWVAGLKYASNWLEWAGTAVAVAISFGGLILSGRRLPTGTAYAVFVGLGTTGTVMAEMIWFGMPFRWEKVLLILLLLTGIMGLKLVTAETKPDTEGRRSA